MEVLGLWRETREQLGTEWRLAMLGVEGPCLSENLFQLCANFRG